MLSSIYALWELAVRNEYPMPPSCARNTEIFEDCDGVGHTELLVVVDPML